MKYHKGSKVEEGARNNRANEGGGRSTERGNKSAERGNGGTGGKGLNGKQNN